MKPHIQIITSNVNTIIPPPHLSKRRRRCIPSFPRHATLSLRSDDAGGRSSEYSAARRAVLLTPLLATVGSSLLQQQSPYSRSMAEEMLSPSPSVTPPKVVVQEEVAVSARIYDATAIGEPLAVGKDKGKVWEKLMNARIIYLGEAEQVPIRDDKELELEMVKSLKKLCVESERPLSLAIEAFPSDLQNQLNQFMDKRFISIAIIYVSN